MTDDAAVWRRLDTVIWSLIGATAATVLLGAAGQGFGVVWTTFLAPVAICAGLLCGGLYYARHRDDPALGSALRATAQLIAFAAVGAPLSYLAASPALPNWDRALDHADRVLGLDWTALLGWMAAHPAIHVVLQLAYSSFALQATATVLALAFVRRLIWLRVFMLAFMVCTLATIVISALMPAEGAWAFHGIRDADHAAVLPIVRDTHLPTLHAIRDGALRTLIGTGSEGIITFPSLHAALGLLFILGFWPVPILRWIGLALNVLMIMATPVEGAHYFVDVFAGLAVATGSWLVALAVYRGLSRPAVRVGASAPDPAVVATTR